MANYVLFTDSSADLNAQQVADLDLNVLPLSFIMDGVSREDWPDKRTMSSKDFYETLRAGTMATTSAVNVEQCTTAWEAALQAGQDVLVLSFSSGLSATCQSAQIAAMELSEKYPDRTVRVVDTLCAAAGQGLLVTLAAEMRLAGKSLEEVATWAEENKLKICHWVTVDDLMHLKRGGRIGAATAMVGSLLSVKPVINVSDEGKLETVGKARGRKTALDLIVSKIGELAPENRPDRVFVGHADAPNDAQYVADKVQELYGLPATLGYIGPVIGAHTGPGCIVLAYLGEKR